MPRPTNAQVAYGFLTVVVSTLTMLLLTEARSGAAVTGVGVGGLALGLLVATAVSVRGRKTAASALPAAVPLAPAVPHARGRAGVGGVAAAQRRVDEASLRG